MSPESNRNHGRFNSTFLRATLAGAFWGAVCLGALNCGSGKAPDTAPPPHGASAIADPTVKPGATAMVKPASAAKAAKTQIQPASTSKGAAKPRAASAPAPANPFPAPAVKVELATTGGAPSFQMVHVASAGQPGAALHVIGVVPVPGDILTNQIVFFFDDAIIPPVGASGALAPPFTITPPIGGTFRVGKNFVAFRSDGMVSAPDLYHVELSPAIQTATGRKLASNQRSYLFASFIFGPTRLWSVENAEDKATLAVEFPTAVRLADVKQHVRVQNAGGTATPVTVEAGATPETCRLAVQGVTNWPLTITITKGLKDATGTLKLARDKTYTYPSDTSLRVTKIAWNEVKPNHYEAHLRFSHPVDAGQLKNRLSISDAVTGAAVPFEMATQGKSQDQKVVLAVATPNADLNLKITRGLPGEQGRILKYDYTTEFGRRARAPHGEPGPLTVESAYWGGGGKDGLELGVHLSNEVNLKDVKEHLKVSPAVTDLRIEPSYNSHGFNLHGQWDSKQSYQLTLTPGLKFGYHGKILKRAVVYTTQCRQVPPYIGFGQEGKFYFPRRAGLSLPILSRNVEQAEITLYRMFPSNIAVSLANLHDGKGDLTFGPSWSEKIGQKQVAVPVRADRLVSTPLELDSLFPKDKRGVFLLKIDARREMTAPRRPGSDGEYGDDFGGYYQSIRTDTKIVLWTNIGLLAHWQNNELVLFAHNLYSLAPLNQAKVTVYSTKNQVLGQSTTNDQGIVQFKNFNTALGVPRVVVAELNGDYTFLELNPRSDESRQFSADMPPYDWGGYDAFIYADRDLYRPGETAHLHWMVRKNYGDALGAVPLLVNVIKPNGRVLLTQPTTLSALGTGGMDLTTQKAYPTGKYQVEIRVPGSTKPIGAYQFSLEEFIPNRIKATVTVAEKHWEPGKAYNIHVNAQHLFGAPAADRKCDAKVVLLREKLATRNWKAFTFGNDSRYSPEPVQLGEARTDKSGNAVFKFQYTAPKRVTFPLKAVAVAQVFELGGRGVVGKAETVLWPSPVALGILARPAEGNQGVQVFAAAINPDETPASLPKVKITLEKQVWDYYVRRYYSNYEPRWSESFEPVETREVDLKDGKGSTVFKMSDYGYYRVRVHSDKTVMYSTASFYCYGGRVQIVNAARPSLIKVTLDKKAYTIGDQAQVKIESPFDGKGIVVVQGDTIQQMIPVEIKNNVGFVKLAVTQKQFPNVWVETTVIHAIHEGKKQVYPFSSTAVVDLRVNDPKRELAVTFPTLPKEIRPSTKATIDVDVHDASGAPAPNAEVTLALVDEGIHLITNYKNPDPYAWLTRPRRPDYRYAHYYDKVAYDFEKSPAGGDMELALRVGAVGKSWIHPVALWSGPIHTDANGRASVTMDIPEFTGQLRAVAVSCTAKAMGSRAADFYVRRPYMLQTSLPRFLLPGDTFHSRSVFFNHSATSCKAKVSWSASGALQQTAGSQEIAVGAHQEATVMADFAARDTMGQGDIKWDTVVTDPSGKQVEHLTKNTPIPVRSPAGYQTENEIIALKPGEGREIRNTKFLNDERSSIAVTVGANPMLRLQKALEYVIGYPYGCVEQTTSRLLPMYLLHKNALFAGPVFKNLGNLDNYLRAGIARLFAMQTASGGLAFWPGSSQPTEYGSVYALHFLTLVKRGRDFDLPEQSFRALQEYVRGIAMNSKHNSECQLYTRAYALYVLALDGDLRAIQQIQRFDDTTLPTPARYLLAAALAQNTHDLDRAKLYLSTRPTEPYSVSEPDDALTSDIRNTAVELMALEQMGGDQNQILSRVNKLVDFLSEHYYGTTQETAFIITALSDYLTKLTVNLDSAAATITGPGIRRQIQGGNVYSSSCRGPNCAFTVTNTGKTTIFVNVTAKGVPEKVVTTPISEGMKLERTLFTSRGEAYTGTTYNQTDSYVVGLEISSDRVLNHLIVSDLLPAGFEIENARLDQDVLTGDTFKGAETPSYLDIRDDRMVLAFDRLAPGKHYYYYVVRAVTPGSYTYPPVEAECMYDSHIHATTAAAKIEVKP